MSVTYVTAYSTGKILFTMQRWKGTMTVSTRQTTYFRFGHRRRILIFEDASYMAGNREPVTKLPGAGMLTAPLYISRDQDHDVLQCPAPNK